MTPNKDAEKGKDMSVCTLFVKYERLFFQTCTAPSGDENLGEKHKKLPIIRRER